MVLSSVLCNVTIILLSSRTMQPLQSSYGESPDRCTTILHLIFHSILRTQSMFRLQGTMTVHKHMVHIKSGHTLRGLFNLHMTSSPWSLHKLYYNITLYEQNLAHTTYCICYNGYAAHHIMLFIRCTAQAHITCWKTVLRRVHKQGTTELSRYHKLCTEPLKMSHNVTQSLHQWNAVPNVTLMSRIVRA